MLYRVQPPLWLCIFVWTPDCTVLTSISQWRLLLLNCVLAWHTMLTRLVCNCTEI